MQESFGMNAIVKKEAVQESARGSNAFRLVMIIITLIIGVMLVAPFFFSRYEMAFGENGVVSLPKTHDIENLLPAMQQFYKAIRSGVIYPRWFADANLGYGTATGNFYPPGIYYLGSLFYALTNDWVDTLFLICALGLMGSGLALYMLARTFYSRLASAVAAILYMLLPYHMLDLYWRGAIPEFVGFVFIPLILYFAYRLGSRGGARYVAAVGLLHGLYLMTHLPVGYLFTYALAFYALVWASRERDFKIAIRIATGMALALVVSAVYWLPAALEGKYIYEWASELFPYHHSYLTLLPTQDLFNQIINNSFTLIVVIQLIAVLVFRVAPRPAVAHTNESDSAGEEAREQVRSYSQTRNWIILGFSTVFMSTSFSIYISQLIPRIQIAVPPFRWLAIASVFAALSAAAIIEHLRKPLNITQGWAWVYRAAIAAAILSNLWITMGVIRGALLNSTYIPPANYMDSGFTPKDSTRPANLPDTPPVVIAPEGGGSEILRWDPQNRQVRVKVDEPATVRLKTYNFRGWTARVDGQTVPLETDKDGAQVVSVPAGIHIVETNFGNTPPRIIGATITIVGFLLVFGLTISDQLRRSKRMSEARAETAKQAGQKSMRAGLMTKIGVISLAVIACLVIALMAARRSNPNSESGSATSQAGGAPSDSKIPITVGSDARLYVEGLDAIPIAADESALGELMTALSRKDGSKIDALAESDRVFRVVRNTKVRVLEMGTGKIKIRVGEGERAMSEGWVLDRWIR
jgi:hypothetical protein